MNKAPQILLAVCPLVITPLIGLALAEGIINLGGGEKDIFWAFVLAIWSAFFAVTAFVLIHRKWQVKRWALRATIVATLTMLALWLLVFTVSMFGLV